MLAIALLAALLAVPVGAAADQATVEVALPGTFDLNEAVLLLGTLDLGAPELQDAGAVDLRELELPDGTLFVCPAEPGQRGEIPPLPVVQEQCRNEDRYEDATLDIGTRTWIRFGTNHTLQAGPGPSMSLFAGAPDAPGLLWAAAPGAPLSLELDQGAMVLRPLIGSSEITVEDQDSTRQYNGTDWLFLFEGDGTLQLDAGGIHGRIQGDLDVQLTPAGAPELERVIEPRRLLDLQDAVLGADAREPARNATRIFDDHGRIPHLVDASILGALNGTAGQLELRPEATSLVTLDALEATLTPGNLEGTAQVRFIQTRGEFATGTREPVGAPWAAAALLWIGAAVTLGVRRNPRFPGQGWRWLHRGALVLAFLAWDLRFGSVTGIAWLEAWRSDASLGVVLGLLGFEVIAFALAAVLIYLPARILATRWSPSGWARWTPLAVAALFTLFLLFTPGSVIALGRTVARI